MQINDKVSGVPVDRLENNPVYKVVVRGYPDSEKLYSCSVASNKYRLIYRLGEWVQPLIGGIFVFDNRIDVFNFRNVNFLITDDAVETWLALANECQKVHSILSHPSNSRDIEYFWAHPTVIMTIKAPHGSLICSAVKLVKRVFWADCRETS